MNIAHILVREGYLDTAEELKDQPLSILIKLKYNQGEPAIQHLKKISKPGKRTYIKSTQIKRVLNGYGLAILSTPRGLLTNKEAHTAHVGGELICEIY